MKTMKCSQLGGACEKEFSAETFDEIAKQSHAHGLEMIRKEDEAHLNAMKTMKEMMKDPQAMMKWFQERKKEFDEMPEK